MLRLAVAGLTPLSPDEAYYWVWSRSLAAGYLDHPPMVALFIRIGTTLAGDGALGIRLLSPLAAALGTVLLARAGDDLFAHRKVGQRAAIALNATLLLGAGAVTMTPDTPLLLFWTASLWSAGRLIATREPAWWLGIGAAGGLALDSKYTAGLLAPVLLAFLLLAWLLVAWPAQRWLRTPWPYAGLLLGLALFSPVILWNADHGWASFLKQGGRVGDFSPGRAAGYLGELVGGQVGLATPGLAVLFAAGLLALRRSGSAGILLACFAAVPLAVFVQHAFGDRVQANWPAIAFPPAAIAAARLGAAWQRWWRPSVVAGAAITGCVYLQALLAPLPLPAALDPTLTRLAGWPGLAAATAAAAGRTGAAYIAVDDYGLAAVLAWSGEPVPVIGVERRWGFVAAPQAAAVLASGPGLLVRSARRNDNPPDADWGKIAAAGELARVRHGVVAETYRLYRVEARRAGQPGGTEAVILPTRRGGFDAPADPG